MWACEAVSVPRSRPVRLASADRVRGRAALYGRTPLYLHRRYYLSLIIACLCQRERRSHALSAVAAGPGTLGAQPAWSRALRCRTHVRTLACPGYMRLVRLDAMCIGATEPRRGLAPALAVSRLRGPAKCASTTKHTSSAPSSVFICLGALCRDLSLHGAPAVVVRTCDHICSRANATRKRHGCAAKQLGLHCLHLICSGKSVLLACMRRLCGTTT